MKNIKLCIIGHARHGKDFAAELLNQNFGLKFQSSSMFCAETILFPVLKDKYGYDNFIDCFQDRVNHRQEWYEIIKNHIINDKALLAKNILAINDIYVGIRDKEEFDAAKNLFDLVIWIDAVERLPIEPITSFNLTKDDADIIITNNSTKEIFEEKIIKLFSLIPYK